MEKNQAEFLMDLFKKRDKIKYHLETINKELQCLKEYNNPSYRSNIILRNISINDNISVESNISILNSMRDIINKEYQNICALCDSYIVSKKVD